MTTDSATQTPTTAAAADQPEVVYCDDPSFLGCSRFEWSALRERPRWRQLVHMLSSPFPGIFITVMVLPRMLGHLIFTPEGARLNSMEGALSFLVIWALFVLVLTYYGARSNEREFAKHYGRILDWELDEARAYFAERQHTQRPTLRSTFQHYWHWLLVSCVVVVGVLLIWGFGEAFLWLISLFILLPWLAVRAEQIEWDDKLSKFGAYLCGPPAPEEPPLDKS